MKNIRMVVTAFSNGNEAYFPLRWTDLDEFTGTGTKWGDGKEKGICKYAKRAENTHAVPRAETRQIIYRRNNK